MKRSVSLLLLGSALALAGCDDPVTPSPPENTLPGDAAITVLGLGSVIERYTGEVWVEGAYAYTTTWGGLPRNGNVGDVLYSWDVTGNTPRRLGSTTIDGASTLGDVQVSDDGKLLVVATEYRPGSIVIFDRTDPANPKQVGRFSSASTAAGVHTAEIARVNGTLYAFLSIDPSPPRLVIVDLSDPANPREVLSREMGNPFIHDVFVRDGLLFTALWDAGMTIWDIGGGGKGGTVANPVQVANIQTVGGSVHNIYWYHDPRTGSKRYAFIGEEIPGGLGSSAGDIHVVDVSDMAAPREVAFFRVSGAGTHNFSVDEASGILYAAYYEGGVRALDIRGDLGSCTAEQKDSRGRCDLAKMSREVGRGLTTKPDAASSQPFVWGVHFVDGALYASDMKNGLWKLDVSALRR